MMFEANLYSNKAHFLSYVKCDKSLVEQVAAETGFLVFTSDTSVSDKMPIPADHVAIWTEEIARDHTVFWTRFRELQEAKEKGVECVCKDQELGV